MPTFDDYQAKIDEYQSILKKAYEGVYRDGKISCKEARKGTTWYTERRETLAELRQQLNEQIIAVRTDYANKIMLTMADDQTKARLLEEKQGIMTACDEMLKELESLIADSDEMLHRFAMKLADCD